MWTFVGILIIAAVVMIALRPRQASEHDEIMQRKHALAGKAQDAATRGLMTGEAGAEEAWREWEAFNRTVEYDGDEFRYKKG